MKSLNLIILALCFCACTNSSNIKKSAEIPARAVPVFMAGMENRTALKITLEAKGKNYNFLLLANKKENFINFKLIGDFAAVLASVNLRGGDFEYETISPLLSDIKAKQVFEEILLALFASGEYGDLKYKYYFNTGEIVPYKLKQKSQLLDKIFLFEDYKGTVPQKITVKTKFDIVKIDFELLAHD